MLTKEIIEGRVKEVYDHQDRLVNAWKPFISAVDKYLQKTADREMNCHEKRNVAQCLENSVLDSGLKSRAKLFEATTEDNISFLGVQLPVIAALLPSLVLNDVAVVQALDRRIGGVFYLDVKNASAKGRVAVDDNMLSATTGHATSKSGRRYAMAFVEKEQISVTDSTVTGTVAYAPGLLQLDQLTIVDVSGNVVATSTSAGVISGTGVTGTITAAGVYSITFSALGSVTHFINYFYQYDLPVDSNNDRDGVPQVDIAVRQETVTAIDFPLRSIYSLGASLDLQKAHGINLESEIVKYLGGEIKFTIDQYGLDLIDEASTSAGSATDPTDWDAQVQSGQEWLWKKHEIEDRFEEASNNIFTKTLRAVGTFIHAGNNVARVIRQLPQFKPVGGGSKAVPTGPMKIGELAGRTVIQNPFKSTNIYTMGYRGDQYLMAGFVYAPYIPLFATPTLITSDLMAQKGFLSAAGFKVINAGMFNEGEITNLGV